MKKTDSILIIVQRSNGDVLLSLPLVESLYKYFNKPNIDLLINDDTLSVAKLLPNIRHIHQFSYQEKRDNRWQQEKRIIRSIYKKYDLSINLTASDRSVIYALLSGRRSISAVEKNQKKSWWKRILLSHYYEFDDEEHILKNNLTPLEILGVDFSPLFKISKPSTKTFERINSKFNIDYKSRFVIFHPSAQYNYKIYPTELRNQLLKLLDSIGVNIVITGGNHKTDQKIKTTLPKLNNAINLIGKTTIKEYIALSEMSLGYIGMDTLNMHIASGQDKPIFAIFGPTKLSMWSPWSNKLQSCATVNSPVQTYDKTTIFQAQIPKIDFACNEKGCFDKNGNKVRFNYTSPQDVFNKIKGWFNNV